MLNLTAEASFSLHHSLRDQPAASDKPFDPVGSYGNFLDILDANLREINKASSADKTASPETPFFTVGRLRDKSGFLARLTDGSVSVVAALPSVASMQRDGRKVCAGVG